MVLIIAKAYLTKTPSTCAKKYKYYKNIMLNIRQNKIKRFLETFHD